MLSDTIMTNNPASQEFLAAVKPQMLNQTAQRSTTSSSKSVVRYTATCLSRTCAQRSLNPNPLIATLRLKSSCLTREIFDDQPIIVR